MIKRAITCGAGVVLIVTTLLLPANVSATGFASPHPGLHRGFASPHPGLHRGFGFHDPGLTRAHHRAYYPYGYGYGYPYGYGYGGPVATYTPGDYGQPVIVVPAQLTPATTVIAPHCTHSRETITVPAEGGGERQVTITRC